MLDFFFDVEASGFHKNGYEHNNPEQSWMVQIGFMLSDEERVYHECAALFKPFMDNAYINKGAERTHGISLEICNLGGIYEIDMVNYLTGCIAMGENVICHNYDFDSKFMKDYLNRCKDEGVDAVALFEQKPNVCTMKLSTDFCKLPGKYGKFKWPKLEELYEILFEEKLEGAHDALVDIRATRRCYYELRKRGVL